ncbi:MAG TPA: hypothetical protein VG456_25975 [Candidatus Sulfopaludibacter sp.]|jgi:DNA-binding response OmpR family regulator|nr:hypothetical protein [Candidatus Sulfopaludibacter sp.]
MATLVDTGVIVIVEDPFIRRYLRSILTRAGLRTMEAEECAAVDLVRSGEVRVAVLITNDPRAFREFAADCALIYTSSSPESTMVEGFERCRILQKPFHADELLKALREVGVIP